MFRNDSLGDCVLAARAHATRRMELIEQGAPAIAITDDEVAAEYFVETGGADSGMNMLDSLKAWRAGWQAAGQHYTIDAYAALDPANATQVKQAMYLLNGVYTGFNLPKSAQSQVGGLWDVVPFYDWDGRAGSWGGHCMWIIGYNATGPIAITWGATQQMTWAFFQKYCDSAECFAIVDSLDAWRDPTKPGIDVAALDADLAAIQAG